jgi:organic radical activating enzyme
MLYRRRDVSPVDWVSLYGSGGDVIVKTLMVKEQFVSFQGTGVNAGLRQSFVRLAGCTVKCPLRSNCDQPESLKRGEGHEASIHGILKNAVHTDWLHITGGEPAEHEHMIALCDAAIELGMRVQVQTSGSIPILWNSHPFVSVSPKQTRLEVKPSEIVLIAGRWLTDDFALSVTVGTTCPVFVVPEATKGKFTSHRMLDVVDTLLRNGINARAGLQSHLIWEVQ